MADDTRVPEVDDDMHDPKDRGAAFPLGAYLTACDPCADTSRQEPCLRSDFDHADEKAKNGQRQYRIITRGAAVAGLGALLVSLGQELFGRFLDERWRAPFFTVEVFYTLFALIIVLGAILAHKHEHWLQERFKAERLRLVKFKRLIDPTLWVSQERDLALVRNRLEADRRAIAHQPEDILEALKSDDALPDLPRTADCLKVDYPALELLLDYYRRKRLKFQMGYFEGKIEGKLPWVANARLSPLFFFAGIICALAYLLLEVATKGVTSDRIEKVSHGLVFFSFAIPLGWSAIRTLQSAHQLSRNRARSHARYAALNEIDRSLNEATGRARADWDRPVIFGYLYASEAILAADQHEWMRLMADAEWYG